MAATPDRRALAASVRRRNLGEAGFSTIISARIADNLRRGIAIPLLARSEAVHFRGSSCAIMYTKILGRFARGLPRTLSPHLSAQPHGRLKGLQKRRNWMWNAFKLAQFEPEDANLPP